MQPMKQLSEQHIRSLRPLPAELTYAAVVDIRSNVEQEITDFMVRRACEEADAQQQYPFTNSQAKRKTVR